MKTKKFLATSCVAFTLLGGGSIITPSVASADRVAVGGGDWNYGYNISNSYSEYYHSYNNHGARVVNKSTGKSGTKNMRRGAWATATVGRNVAEKATFYFKANGYY